MKWFWKKKYNGRLPLLPMNFSVEIFYEIFSHLNQFDILQVILINKQFYELGIRELYKCLLVDNGTDRYIISQHMRTSFTTKYTIIDGIQLFKKKVFKRKRMKFVQLVIFRRDTCLDAIYQDMIRKYPWVEIRIMDPDFMSDKGPFYTNQKLKLQAKTLTRLKIEPNLFIKVEDDNYSIIEYVINTTPTPVLLSSIPKLKRLETLCILDPQSNHLITDLQSSQLSDICLKTLILKVSSIQLSSLGEIFNLTTITKLKLEFTKNVAAPYEELKTLTSNLPRLNSISINWRFTNAVIIMDYLVGKNIRHISVKTNEEIDYSYLKYYPTNFMKHQQLISLHLWGNPPTPPPPVKTRSRLISWFSKKETPCDDLHTSKINAIRGFIDGGFPNLNQIILNGWFFMITGKREVKLEHWPNSHMSCICCF
ncbi:uncharacterized protein SPAPADRAFT_68010 [Spathaspora passalidarum NRRL Y-27907]|uniref:F-box domain-containing protein n=1 Tax=Spathaspora passalidarum (strain NRRL Y-27907 / 11-Y1) TaxID=619300 RepID=G3ASY9_SPAPN|nr:uncharacterized protein SPAPADRAFT_68010 [Spathaspora passalidarum NRRL Y-27907]EGW30770.1 hypothetical protein SPAPADRAFT_68010 [Spathaspora passalidarum NRRL Y-27907]